jgi:hypothetical protein
LRKTVGFEAVTEYPHLEGALYRKVILEDKFVGSVATYLVVLNALPVCDINAPLLLLTTKKKKQEFCNWLISDLSQVTLEEKRVYQLYLLEHHLIEDKEVEKAMRHHLFGPPDHSWIFDELEERSPDEQERFRQLFYEKMLHASSPLEVAQKALQADSPLEVAQKALHASSPIEVALKFIQSEEQLRELTARLQQMSIQTPSAVEPALASA